MPSNWNRFTLMDSVGLVAAFAIGMGITTHFAKTDTPLSGVPPELSWAVESVLWAGMVAGPLILMAQAFRGRRSRLSIGEWLWISPEVRP